MYINNEIILTLLRYFLSWSMELNNEKNNKKEVTHYKLSISTLAISAFGRYFSFWKLFYFFTRRNVRRFHWYLRRYDTKKIADESFLKFSELFIIGKFVKIRFKNRRSPCYFLSSRDQKIKNIANIDQKRLFLFLFLGLFVMAFLVQKLIYMKALWFNFVFRSFFEADHLLSNYFRSLSEKITILIDINH